MDKSFEQKKSPEISEGSWVEIPGLGRPYFCPANFTEKDKELWKENVIERARRAKKLSQEFSSKEVETLKETTEEAFAKLLGETGYFDEARPADWVNDALDKCDVIVKLEDGGYLAVQHSVEIPNQGLAEKREEIIKQGKVMLPEHLEYGEIPIVFVKDNYKNYIEKEFNIDTPWIEYYKKKLRTNPQAKLWKYFENINEMIGGWLSQIEESLTEEIKIHPEDKKIYEDYLEKIQKTKKMHAELTAS